MHTKKVRIIDTSESGVGLVWIELPEGHQICLIDLNKMKVAATAFYGEPVTCVQSHPINPNIATISTRNFIKNIEAKDGGF